MNKKALLATVLIATAGVPAVSMAQLSANAGYVSDYIFRGFYQEESSPFAGIDYESSGFYVGTWAADVGDGLETDVYFGYGGGSDDFGWSIGFTGYFYTEDTFDDTYQEINLGISSGGFAADVALGEYDNFGASVDYTYIGLSYGLENGTSFLIAQTDFDGVGGGPGADGVWLEISHAWALTDDVELALTYLFSPDGDEPDSTIVLSGDNPFATDALVLGLTKSFSFGN